MEWFLQFWEQVKVWWTEPTRLWLVPKKPLREKGFRSIEEVSNEVTWVITGINNECVQTGIQDLPTRWTTVGWAHQALTCSQNWRNHSVGKASVALRRCLMRWPE
jgi:hypothetical protein